MTSTPYGRNSPWMSTRSLPTLPRPGDNFECVESTGIAIFTPRQAGTRQPPTPLRTDNSTADGIMNKTIKQKQSKAMDKRFYWVQDRVEQGEYRVFWAPGKVNLADYYTKYHSPATHRKLRPIYTYIEEKSHEASQDILLSDMNRKLPKERLAIRREFFCWGRYKSIPTALTLI
ncbi:hypothetical protein FRACYDRAFT_245988 [Fragilariopsis cylindrus CCMP1102]|uniref:Uncharacterized protein n=1 Tax=Fragilariopsis cylindrus CCMP1102 TaxID=635003 RepID=A0A1E7F0T6_9STRA|nr:hypothetical protein FRACYDRAFT_245988 [Fragilariopsis cylindrus CCMP1102]|eukprot:OEU11423.1 hypothetical protein FRACYDRAFT_245988 [Fragilariopsis cylindrus CCMP1102]